MPKTLNTIDQFSVALTREVDETTTREENGVKITETTKVKKPVDFFFCLKVPSRAERELADEERAAWWSRYVEKGILPQALLLKTYANYGGILSNEENGSYLSMQAQFADVTEQLRETMIMDDDKRQELNTRYIDLRSKILAFEQDKAVFFDNTAEAKARAKLTEYLILHLTYWRQDEEKDWEPYFKGTTTVERLNYLDKLQDGNDELFGKVYQRLAFVTHLYSSNGGVNKAALDEYFQALGTPA